MRNRILIVNLYHHTNFNAESCYDFAIDTFRFSQIVQIVSYKSFPVRPPLGTSKPWKRK